jgi:hypothetical protein
MTAVILQFDRSRLKCLKKVEPGQARLRDLIRADAEQAIAELEAEARFDDEEADTMLFIGPCGEWRQCDRCFNEINPATTISQDLTTGDVHCIKCFHACGK